LQRLTSESEAACREALRIALESAAAFAVLAEVRADTGRFSEAEECFKRAVSNRGDCQQMAGPAGN
jgi:Tfp pilus assembly protein PilF